jgi:hypothetical protein
MWLDPSPVQGTSPGLVNIRLLFETQPLLTVITPVTVASAKFTVICKHPCYVFTRKSLFRHTQRNLMPFKNAFILNTLDVSRLQPALFMLALGFVVCDGKDPNCSNNTYDYHLKTVRCCWQCLLAPASSGCKNKVSAVR